MFAIMLMTGHTSLQTKEKRSCTI